MKKKIKFLTVGILLTLSPSFLIGEGNKGSSPKIEGGNGEVLSKKNFFKNKKEFQEVIDKIYTVAVVGLEFVEQALKAVSGRAGDGYTIHEDINLSMVERFIIHAQLAEGQYPITCNIKGIELIQNEKRFTIHIPKELIDDKIIIYNRNREVLMEYNVSK